MKGTRVVFEAAATAAATHFQAPAQVQSTWVPLASTLLVAGVANTLVFPGCSIVKGAMAVALRKGAGWKGRPGDLDHLMGARCDTTILMALQEEGWSAKDAEGVLPGLVSTYKASLNSAIEDCDPCAETLPDAPETMDFLLSMGTKVALDTGLSKDTMALVRHKFSNMFDWNAFEGCCCAVPRPASNSVAFWMDALHMSPTTGGFVVKAGATRADMASCANLTGVYVIGVHIPGFATASENALVATGADEVINDLVDLPAAMLFAHGPTFRT